MSIRDVIFAIGIGGGLAVLAGYTAEFFDLSRPASIHLGMVTAVLILWLARRVA